MIPIVECNAAQIHVFLKKEVLPYGRVYRSQGSNTQTKPKKTYPGVVQITWRKVQCIGKGYEEFLR